MGETEEEREDIAKREVVPLRLLKRSNEEQMRKLYNLIQFTPETIHWSSPPGESHGKKPKNKL